MVDASKGLAHALAITRAGGIDLRLVHLVRDARGVAFSWAKSGVERPHAASTSLSTFDTEFSAFHWTVLQTEIALAKRQFTSSTRIRYEDLVRRPADELSRALTEIGFPVTPAELGHIDGTSVDLPASHGLSGNPSRFRQGVQELRLDEQWRRDMTRWDRAKATTIALVPLAAHGYLSRHRTQVST